MKNLISLLFVVVLAASAAAAQQQLKVGQSAPVFSGTTLNGESVDTAGLRGRVAVVTFWSTRCEICRYEAPKLNALAARFDRSKVAFIAFSTQDAATIRRYLTSNPFDFSIVPDSFGTLLQFADRDRSGNVDMGYPSFFVIDADGKIQHRSSGVSKTAEIESAVSRLVRR